MSTTTTTPQPVHKPPKTLPQLLDSSGTSLLPPPLFQGAESLIYSLPFSALYPSLPTSPLLILKHRFPKKYRHPTIDNRITKHRTKSEVKCIARCRRAGVLCPIIYGVGPDYIVMENVGTRTLRSYLQTLPPSSTLSPPAITALKLLTQSIIKIHSASVVHGDLTTGNFMFTAESKIVAIDFGLSSICAPNQGSKKRKQNDQSGASNNRIEAFAVDLYVLERALVSAHQFGEEMVMVVVNEYKENSREGDRVIQKLTEVRSRGRKRECFG